MESRMSEEGQRPPASAAPQASGGDAPEPGNARYPQPGGGGSGGGNGGNPGNSQAQQQEGQGRRKFRRNRRGGRGRRGKSGGHGQQGQTPPPLDAQGRIVDVENDSADDGGPDEAVTPAEGVQPVQAQDAQPPQTGPAGEGAPAPQNLDGMPQPPPQQQGQGQRHQQ